METAGMMAALMGAGILQPEHFIKRSKSEAKKYCLQCKKEHNHNNAFCSAECCKKFKNKRTNLWKI